jgi:S-disulfanyl-L-cysteine oxidoreductase SoxD
MRCSKFLVPALLFAGVTVAAAQTPSYTHVGRTPSKDEIQAWSISVGPDGKGLPPGSGTAKQGAAIFATKCAYCHGANAQGGGIGTRLAGDKAAQDSLTTIHPVKTVGSYWPYATTIWDYINRAMPRNQAGSLKPDEVYSLTAFILFRSSIIQENDVMDARSLTKVQMPNRNGFVPPRFEDIPDEHKRGCREGVCP